MHLVITGDTDTTSGLGEVIDKTSGPTRMFFIRKDYGPDVAGICVVLMCQRASLNLKQRVRFYKKDRQLYLDVMFDLAEMEGLDPDGRMLAVGQNVAAVTRATLAKYAFEQFDAERFLADFEQWWKRHTEELQKGTDALPSSTSETSGESARMTITEHLCSERPGEAELVSCSDWVQGTLPDDYKSFLKSENGGRPEPDGFQFTTRDGKAEMDTLNYFFGLHEGKVGSLRRKFELYKERIPAGFLPIATDPFGNLILLKIAEPKSGRVYFWDHEEEEDLPTLRNMSKIADSFSEFVAGLEG